jgi:hypothetical protein
MPGSPGNRRGWPRASTTSGLCGVSAASMQRAQIDLSFGHTRGERCMQPPLGLLIVAALRQDRTEAEPGFGHAVLGGPLEPALLILGPPALSIKMATDISAQLRLFRSPRARTLRSQVSAASSSPRSPGHGSRSTICTPAGYLMIAGSDAVIPLVPARPDPAGSGPYDPGRYRLVPAPRPEPRARKLQKSGVRALYGVVTRSPDHLEPAGFHGPALGAGLPASRRRARQ